MLVNLVRGWEYPYDIAWREARRHRTPHAVPPHTPNQVLSASAEDSSPRHRYDIHTSAAGTLTPPEDVPGKESAAKSITGTPSVTILRRDRNQNKRQKEDGGRAQPRGRTPESKASSVILRTVGEPPPARAQENKFSPKNPPPKRPKRQVAGWLCGDDESRAARKGIQSMSRRGRGKRRRLSKYPPNPPSTKYRRGKWQAPQKIFHFTAPESPACLRKQGRGDAALSPGHPTPPRPNHQRISTPIAHQARCACTHILPSSTRPPAPENTREEARWGLSLLPRFYTPNNAAPLSRLLYARARLSHTCRRASDSGAGGERARRGKEDDKGKVGGERGGREATGRWGENEEGGELGEDGEREDEDGARGGRGGRQAESEMERWRARRGENEEEGREGRREGRSRDEKGRGRVDDEGGKGGEVSARKRDKRREEDEEDGRQKGREAGIGTRTRRSRRRRVGEGDEDEVLGKGATTMRVTIAQTEAAYRVGNTTTTVMVRLLLVGIGVGCGLGLGACNGAVCQSGHQLHEEKPEEKRREERPRDWVLHESDEFEARTWTMSKADDFGVPDVDIVAAAEEAGEVGAGGLPAAPSRSDSTFLQEYLDLQGFSCFALGRDTR
ncbi:hypothetical protein B0H14DRAFT_2560737 [Mycena olivaceomarginata]|nr:hypothetical protein B0H14DRAFT_2560737 [Mycena olivaceomarginata]